MEFVKTKLRDKLNKYKNKNSSDKITEYEKKTIKSIEQGLRDCNDLVVLKQYYTFINELDNNIVVRNQPIIIKDEESTRNNIDIGEYTIANIDDPELQNLFRIQNINEVSELTAEVGRLTAEVERLTAEVERLNNLSSSSP